ncbi:hypothetical protein Tco_1262989 [Tanacetum coccineum]
MLMVPATSDDPVSYPNSSKLIPKHLISITVSPYSSPPYGSRLSSLNRYCNALINQLTPLQSLDPSKIINQGIQTTLAMGVLQGQYAPEEQWNKSEGVQTVATNKRKRDDSWFKDKVLLVQAQASGQILHEEELAFLADPRIPEDTLAEYVIESQQAAVQNSNSSAQQDALILSVIEQLKTQVVNCTKINLDNKSVNDTLTAELERYKEQVKVLKKGQNVLIIRRKAQQLEPKLYDGNVINNTSTILIPDSEETLMLAEESRSKMLLKQKDHMMLEKKVNTTPVNIAFPLMQLSQDFEKRFVPPTELSAEHAFWSHNFVNSPKPTISSRLTKVEVPKELPKVSMVNTSLKKLKHHLAGFDVVVKERTTPTTITKGS